MLLRRVSGGASFRTTLADDGLLSSRRLYGENEGEDDSENENLAFDDDMCVTVDQLPREYSIRKNFFPFRHFFPLVSGVLRQRLPPIHRVISQDGEYWLTPTTVGSRLLTISNAGLAPERASHHACVLDEVDSSFFGGLFNTVSSDDTSRSITVSALATKPKRRLSTTILSVFSSRKPAKRARRQVSNDNEDYFIIASTSQIRTYSPSDIMVATRQQHPHSRSSPRRILLSTMTAQAKLATRTITALKRRCGIAMARPSAPNKPTKCVAVGAAAC